MKLAPLGDKVILKQLEAQEATKSGILLTSQAKEKPQEARVVALGTGKVDEDGKKIEFEVKVGDIVLTSKYGGTEVKVDGKEYKLVSASDILAIVG